VHKIIDEIVENNNWRDGEFAKLKATSIDRNDKLWNRMCIPMIYAHWEGFTADSLKILLNHLNQIKLNPTNIPTRLVVASLGDTYKSLSGKQSFIQKIEFTEKFNQALNSPIKFKTKIDTKSNLNSSALNEICTNIGLSFEKFSSVTNDIDRLVHIRNCIAHGENAIIPDTENVLKYINCVKSAIDILLEEINNFLEKELYLISPKETPEQQK